MHQFVTNLKTPGISVLS